MREKLTHKTSRHIVAYIDILGASEMIKKKENVTLDKVHKIYDQALYFSKRLCKGDLDKLKIKIFSDNIIVSYEVKQHNPYSFSFVTYFSSYLQLFFASNGILVRGAITKGNFYIDDAMVWGKALLRAVKLEKTVAVYPRIVLDSNAFPGLSNIRNFETKKHFIKDIDGIYYLNYLYLADDSELRAVEEARKKINEALFENLNIKQKYEWHDNYFKKHKSNLNA